jgi:ribosomal protein S18 acetylase RimI-like enzyme
MVGYALFYPAFSSFRGERGLYLEDLYIDPEYRRHDLGHRMIKALAARASELGYERIDFLVLDWNEPAVNFYLKHGAERNDDESHFKFAGDAFRVLAAK